MDCPVEANLIRKTLRTMPEIEDLSFDFVDRILTVTHTADAGDIEKKLDSVGLDPRRVGHPSAFKTASRNFEYKYWVVGGSVVCAAAAELIAWGAELTDHSHGDRLPIVILLSMVAVVLTLPPILKKAWFAIRGKTITISLLVTIAVVGAILLGQFPEAGMTASLFALSEAIEAASVKRAGNAIKSLLSSTPITCEVVLDTQTASDIPTNMVVLGDTVRIRPGGIIPLDGRVLAGISEVDQSSLTGESLPVIVEAGSDVYAGTRNTAGTFVMEVTAVSGNTSMDRVIKSVRTAAGDRATTERLVDRFASIYTPVVVILAFIIAFFVPFLLREPFQPWISKALILLVIACPCALVISTPVTVISALTVAAQAGAMIRSGKVLEALADTTMIVFDKTGTLTSGTPTVTDVVPLVESMSVDTLLHLAASVNFPSEHPIGVAIVRHCSERHTCEPAALDTFEALIGRGVAASINGKMHFIGSHRLVHDNNVCGEHVETVLNSLDQEGKSTVVLMSSGEALAVIAVQDTLRAEAAEAIEGASRLALCTALLTGDNAASANYFGRLAGITNITSESLPLEKKHAIKKWQDNGEFVVMVGDGINDSAAISQANIGIAMSKNASAVAIDIADIALLRTDLRLVPGIVRLSRQVRNTLRANIAIALIFKLFFLVCTFTGSVQLWMAVLADVGAALIVTVNGLRLLKAKVI